MGEFVSFDKVRPCQHDAGMSLLMQADVSDDDGRVVIYLQHATQSAAEEDGQEDDVSHDETVEDFAGTSEMLADFFDMFLRGREYCSRQEAAQRAWGEPRKLPIKYTLGYIG